MTEENLNKECASELSVRLHLDSLESNYFDKRAEVFVKDNLERLKQVDQFYIWRGKRQKR